MTAKEWWERCKVGGVVTLSDEDGEALRLTYRAALTEFGTREAQDGKVLSEEGRRGFREAFEAGWWRGMSWCASREQSEE